MNVIFSLPGLAAQRKRQLVLTVLALLMLQWRSVQDIPVSGIVTGEGIPLR